MIYFDWTATTPVSEHALDVYCRTSKDFPGNPSSTHPLGRQALTELEKCRISVASHIKAKPSEIYFTSGGTESDAIVLSSLLNNLTPGEVIVSGIEHSAVLEYRTILEKSGWKFTVLKCDKGYLDPLVLENALNEKVRMVCVMAVNNVTGTIQDIDGITRTVRDFEKKTGRKIHIHCDAVQALTKIPFEVGDLDSAAFSAHKFFGPRGVGFLYCRNKALLSLSRGGGQEKGLRPGTENLPAIAAMTAALDDAMAEMDQNFRKVSEYRTIIENVCAEKGYGILSPSGQSQNSFSPYILCISVRNLPSEVFLRMMADKGFCLSAGSACSSNSRGKAESVLTMMNIPSRDRMSAVRISFSGRNTIEEVRQLETELRNGKF